MVSNWSLSDSKSPQVSKILLNTLTDPNAFGSLVSARPLISKFSSPFINPLVTVLNAPITIGINVTFMFHSFFQFSRKVHVLIFSLSLSLTLLSAGTANSTIGQVLNFFFFLCCWLCLCLVVWLKLRDLFVSQNPIEMCASQSRTVSELCIYRLFEWSNFSFLHNFKWINFPT